MTLYAGTAMQSGDEGEKSPAQYAQHWAKEIAAAKKATKLWHEQSKKILKRLKDDRGYLDTSSSTKLNLFAANIQTLRALLYGKVPSVDVARRFADSGDHIARISAEMFQRLLNTDIEEGHDSYAASLQHALDDRLIVGFGNAKVRYEAEIESEEVKAIKHPETGAVLADAYTKQNKTDENVEVDYFHWEDQLWSPCRTFGEVTWWAFKTAMSREKLVERFGEELGNTVPLNTKNHDSILDGEAVNDPTARADVWEIWDKENKCVHWWVEGYPRTLDDKDDPLELEGFWPFPRPMFANLTNSSLIPLADFMLARDLYEDIDELEDQLQRLIRAVQVRGVYDKTSPAVGRLLNEAKANDLIPIENWGMFAGQGGIKGVVDWLPLDQITNAIDKLSEYQLAKINKLYQVTGMSDIMRGQAAGVTTATEQAIKARFASVRVQSLQDEFARFATELQKIKAEIISKHFDPQTILEKSNVQYTPDAQNAMAAVQLIKSHFFLYRIEVKPESVSLTDYAALKTERTEYLQATAGFIQTMVPMATALPASMPYLLQMLQWGLSGFRGSSTIEGVLDQAIAKVEALEQQKAAMPPQPPPPDPKLMAAQVKAQGDIQKTQAELKADVVRSQVEVQADNTRQMNNAKWNIVQAHGTEQAKAMASIDAITRHPTGGIP